MKKEMAKVESCEARECLYNRVGLCGTYGITVGSEEACCDTYVHGSAKGGMPGMTAGVGACRMSSCKHNEKFECSAKGIAVSIVTDHPDCVTYAMR